MAKNNDLKAARLVAGITQGELAMMIGVNSSTVCMWEAGKQKPAPAKYRALAEALALPTEAVVKMFIA